MDSLKRMFNPTTIALIGASAEEGSPGRQLRDNLLTCRERKIFTVNPRHSCLDGSPCYPHIAAVPEHVDLAIVATPAPTVPGIVEACGQAGVDGMIIISAGFRESGEEGRHLEEEILRIKKQYPLRILGPNCLGIIRPHAGLCASRLPGAPEAGPIAFITQSNAFGKILFDWGVSAHISFSMLASLGSALDIDFGDLIDYLGEDPHTRSIMIYMEDEIGHLRKFLGAARGFARNKPIVLLRPARLNGDAPEKISHTDILAGPDDIFDAVLRRVGVVRVKETQDLYNTANVLYSRKLPRGERLAVVGNAGGAGLMAAHRLTKSGGALADLAPATWEGLTRMLPPPVRAGNPLDLTRSAAVGDYEGALRLFLQDDNVDGVLAIFGPQGIARDEELAAAIAAVGRDAVKPVLATWLERGREGGGRELLLRSGIPTYETPEEAARTYVYMYNYERNLRLLHETPAELPVNEAPPKNHLKSLVRKVLREGRNVLAEEEAKKFLANYGIPFVKTQIARSAEEAVAAAQDIGYPVVLKIASHDIIFRQDVGGVVTGIDSDEAARIAFARLRERVARIRPDAAIRGVVVQKMIEVIDYELILGAKKDKDYGAVILFGMGGVGVEIFRDYSIALPPLNQALARRLMEETKAFSMLRGYRGKTPADLAQLEGMIVNFSNLVMDFPEILTMDMNPVAVRDGQAVALDVRIILDRDKIDPTAPYPHLLFTPYPTRYVSRGRLRDGREIVLRPIRPEDEPLAHDMFTTLSEATLRERFYQTIKTITHEMHVRFCNIDYDREMMLVAEIRDNGSRRLIGMGGFNIEADFRKCEFSILVHDDFQGQGLAHKMIDILIGIADEKGLEEFYGYIEPQNRRMVRLCEKLGMSAEKSPDDLTRVSLLLR
ncbi:MAG: bifunctional acetate--CoA ligase family protein/GNAT family N-acetyltransferase [Pseudomonadota bacterium]|nr:bifunctional acetate--CoA ligase family protein/GNAT family N-acetyltransferase [Pseudomonadota bacterium]